MAMTRAAAAFVACAGTNEFHVASEEARIPGAAGVDATAVARAARAGIPSAVTATAIALARVIATLEVRRDARIPLSSRPYDSRNSDSAFLIRLPIDERATPVRRAISAFGKSSRK